RQPCAGAHGGGSASAGVAVRRPAPASANATTAAMRAVFMSVSSCDWPSCYRGWRGRHLNGCPRDPVSFSPLRRHPAWVRAAGTKNGFAMLADPQAGDCDQFVILENQWAARAEPWWYACLLEQVAQFAGVRLAGRLDPFAATAQTYDECPIEAYVGRARRFRSRRFQHQRSAVARQRKRCTGPFRLPVFRRCCQRWRRVQTPAPDANFGTRPRDQGRAVVRGACGLPL